MSGVLILGKEWMHSFNDGIVRWIDGVVSVLALKPVNISEEMIDLSRVRFNRINVGE